MTHSLSWDEIFTLASATDTSFRVQFYSDNLYAVGLGDPMAGFTAQESDLTDEEARLWLDAQLTLQQFASTNPKR